MGDGDRRAAVTELVQRRLERALGAIVQRGCGLIENKHLRIAQDGPCDREPLLLATGESMATRPDDGVQAVRESGHQVRHLRRGQGLPQFTLAGRGPRQQQIGADAVVD